MEVDEEVRADVDGEDVNDDDWDEVNWGSEADSSVI